MKIEQNISRLKYLLEIYKITVDELLIMISEGLKVPLRKSDIFGNEIKLSHLKRIDSIFNKGLHFYLDPKSPEISKDASIFFRKSEFGVDLNIGARKIVNQFEEFKISLSAIAKLAEVDFKRELPVYSIQQNPKIVAKQLRKEFYPEFNSKPKEFLRSFIGKLAEKNILVFEFVETWNKKDKANIDGFFLNPNVIVLKRQQNSFRREIFTLTHELGHYLLNEEEVEQLDIQNLASHKISAIERWCNDFAYYFLVGNYDNQIEEIDKAVGSNDYYFEIIESISKNTHLSKIAMFTRLLFQNKLSRKNYNFIKVDLEEKFRLKQEEEKKKKELEKLEGIKSGGATPKPIQSPLLISTIQTAFFEGVISEFDVCKTLNIKPDKIESFLQ
ncbi:MAG: ImmA/IrrE family metallo-endopeptidase [Bacteroidales bacterium]|nr:ImmA/IrrE family metallo-endopeptidase [Bacteroidales bacterium]